MRDSQIEIFRLGLPRLEFVRELIENALIVDHIHFPRHRGDEYDAISAHPVRTARILESQAYSSLLEALATLHR